MQSVIAALPDEAELDVLASESARDAVAGWTRGHPSAVRLHVAPDSLNFSHWAQDAFTAATDENGAPLLLTSSEFARYQDLEAARLLADAADVSTVEIATPLDGGNILAVGDRLLIGADLAGHMEDGFPALDDRRPTPVGCTDPAPASETRPSSHLPDGWREIIRSAIPAGSRQPLFHIDLFVAPAGDNRFLVGCPRLGAEALGLDLLDHADADRFDAAAARLSADGAEVIRNPQPLIWFDDPESRTRSWLHLPVNNVIAEDGGPGRRTVWLPSFAQDHWRPLQAIDRANAAIWRDLGFDVRLVPDLMELAENRGALNCMCKVVSRSPV